MSVYIFWIALCTFYTYIYTKQNKQKLHTNLCYNTERISVRLISLT